MQHQPISQEIHKNYLMQGLRDFSLFALQENVTEIEARKFLSKDERVSRKTKEYMSKLKENDFYMGYDFKKIDFIDKKLSNQIAQSNILIETTKVANVEVILMIAARDIEKNESIGFSYGIMYWQHPSIKESPLLFTKEGKIIPAKNNYRYKPDNINLSLSSDESSSDEEEPTNVLLNRLKALSPIFSTDRAQPEPKNKLNNNLEESSKTILENHVKLVEHQLQAKTLLFFNKPVNTEWRKFPENRLVDKYSGHELRFMTMPLNEAEQAKAFFQVLKQSGFDTELKKAKDKPSIIVDLTASKLII